MTKTAIETKRLYRFEDTVLIHDRYLNKQRSYKSIMVEAHRIWKKHGPSHIKMPRIVFGKGTKFNGRYLSYCLGQSYIELAYGQRDYLTLFHELVHAMGPINHSKPFLTRYFNILYDYQGKR